ncbi:hypothetical protein CDL15_Pgr002256 [Punica granatum]|uniref:Uncharacterized protein n=1 Tax=Punica granatum TaxID=22663 RepID=A0A218XDW9_PUNGR|nr:hypothetical protein CDL15_Pgr002256 [Punica granatum]
MPQRAPATPIGMGRGWGLGSTPKIERIPNVRVLSILRGGALDSDHHPSIGVAGALSPIGIVGASVTK